MVLDDLQHAGRAETCKHFGILVLASGLSQIDGMTEDILDVLRHRIQIALGGTDPFDGFARLLQHSP